MTSLELYFLMDCVMELWRARGSVVVRSEEGLTVWIRVLREGFMDLNPSFVVEERNSSAEDLREERSLFSIDEF